MAERLSSKVMTGNSIEGLTFLCDATIEAVRSRHRLIAEDAGIGMPPRPPEVWPCNSCGRCRVVDDLPRLDVASNSVVASPPVSSSMVDSTGVTS